MEFNYEKHQKLWNLLSENIADAAKRNHEGNGYYCGYSALEKLKRRLLQEYFSDEDQKITNLCFACSTAVEEEWQRDWHEPGSINCAYCPLNWPGEKQCDDIGSLYSKLIKHLEDNDITDAAAICIEIANVRPYTDEEYEKKIPWQKSW